MSTRNHPLFHVLMYFGVLLNKFTYLQGKPYTYKGVEKVHIYNIVRTCRYMTIENNTKGMKEYMTTHILTFTPIIRSLVQGHI